MPVYVFENAEGHQIEREFRVDECPQRIGAYKKIVCPFSRVGGDSPEDFDRTFGKGATDLLLSDKAYREKTQGKAADAGFKGPGWARPRA